jgi:RHS repeat-associated protein
MLGDGSNAFTWNARNQVATLDSVGLQYDAFGRRTKNAAGTSFLFDGANTVQELSGTAVTANILTGGLDESFQRSDTNGTVVGLEDALGSTIALVDSSGTIKTTYSYDPFGNTTTAGAASSNPAQYTGRENEGNGLYFYRARYYSPLLGRFINEDPLGFQGGNVDLYGYAFDNPLNWIDPSGLDAQITYWKDDAHGFVHIGIAVNSSQTSGFYSTKQPTCLVFGCDDNGRVLDDRQDHPGVTPETIIILTTPEQDRAMQAVIDARRNNPGKYNLYGRNCTKFVHDVLRAAGIPDLPDEYLPEKLWNNLKKRATLLDLASILHWDTHRAQLRLREMRELNSAQKRKLTMGMTRTSWVGLLLALAGLGIFGGRSVWSMTRSSVPVDMPISLSPHQVRIPDLKSNLEALYIIEIEVEKKTIPFETLNCLLGVEHTGPEKCSNTPSVVNVSWVLSSQGVPVTQGSSADTSAGDWGTNTIARQLGSFRADKARRYTLDLNVLTDGSRLASGNPRLKIAVHPSFYEGSAFGDLPFVLTAACVFLAGVIVFTVSRVRARYR